MLWTACFTSHTALEKIVVGLLVVNYEVHIKRCMYVLVFSSQVLFQSSCTSYPAHTRFQFSKKVGVSWRIAGKIPIYNPDPQKKKEYWKRDATQSNLS